MKNITYRFWNKAIFCTMLGFSLSAHANLESSIKQGRAALIANHPYAAESYFKQALSESANLPESAQIRALSGLGYAALWLGHDHLGERVYRKGIAIAKTNADKDTMRIGLARALIGLGRPNEAYEILQGETSISPGAALQSAIAANLLDWNTRAAGLLREAAPSGHYVGPDWLQRLYGETADFVGFALKPHINAGYHYSSDSDHNINQIYDAGVTIPGAGLGDNLLNPTMWHVYYRRTQITDSVGQVGISTLSGGWATSLNRDWKYWLQGGVGTSRSWTFGQVAGQLSYQPNDDWGLDLGVDRAPIRTDQAVQNRILMNTMSLGGFGRLRDVGTLAASYFNQQFSDGNHRNGVVARVTPEFYSFDSVPVSLGVQGYFRYYVSGQVPSDGYFNPLHYREALGYVIYVQKFSPFWIMRLYAGFGSQTVDGTTTPVKDIYGTLSGLVSPYVQISLTGGYTQVASVYGGGPGYHRSYVQANLSIPFN